jgi:lipooligosaccharide transport system permease protein
MSAPSAGRGPGPLALTLRILPVGLGSRRALLLIERNVYIYRSGWLVIFSGFFEPLFYLLSIGLGIGGIVGDIPGPNGDLIPYALFVAPALLASASMNGAIAESTFNVFFKLNYQKTYDAVLATPLGPGDVALGEIGWAMIRSTLYALGFIVVIAVLGLVASPWAILAVPAATLLAFAFAAAGMAATTFMRTWQDFDLVQLVVLPLFLFSGTFYPISAYPEALQAFVMLTPLWHGVDLIRALVTGAVDPGILVHVGYLAAMGLIGLAVVARRLDKLLLK